jgi:hypothetical protein
MLLIMNRSWIECPKRAVPAHSAYAALAARSNVPLVSTREMTDQVILKCEPEVAEVLRIEATRICPDAVGVIRRPLRAWAQRESSA